MPRLLCGEGVREEAIFRHKVPILNALNMRRKIAREFWQCDPGIQPCLRVCRYPS
jgi:hypothetical protein